MGKRTRYLGFALKCFSHDKKKKILPKKARKEAEIRLSKC